MSLSDLRWAGKSTKMLKFCSQKNELFHFARFSSLLVPHSLQNSFLTFFRHTSCAGTLPYKKNPPNLGDMSDRSCKHVWFPKIPFVNYHRDFLENPWGSTGFSTSTTYISELKWIFLVEQSLECEVISQKTQKRGLKWMGHQEQQKIYTIEKFVFFEQIFNVFQPT